VCESCGKAAKFARLMAMARHSLCITPHPWCVGLLVVCCALASWAVQAHDVLRNVEYAIVDGISLRLDLYLPHPAASDPVPLVIWVHGGGWRSGSKDGTYAPETLGESYAVASVEYRLSDMATFPAQIHDVKAAVRWLRAHASEYGFDPQRFGAWGSSAGGHLVALLGVSCGNEDLEGTVGEYLGEASCVQAVCDFYGPTDLSALMVQRSLGDERRPMPEDLLLGGSVEDCAALAALASPMFHISPSAPPFLIMHGSDDATVPVVQSIAFDEALRGAGVDSTLIVIEGAGHGFPREHLVAVKPWFDQHLANQPSSSATAESVAAFHRRGQTFLTWSEGDGDWFAIYRVEHTIGSTSELIEADRVAIIPKGTSLNERASAVEGQPRSYVIEEGAPDLSSDTGLYVHTTTMPGDAFYAVAVCNETGQIQEWVGTLGPVTEYVDVPVPVLQSSSTVKDSLRAHYVHWAPAIDTQRALALANRPNQAFNFVVWEPLGIEPSGAAVFALHGGGGSYANASPLPNHPELTVISPDSYIPGSPEGLDRSWDAWYGYNENVGLHRPFSEGLNVDYTTRRLRWMAQWLIASNPHIDANRLFLRGSSMGGVGTVFSSILLRDVFAAGLAIVPRFDYGADDVFTESFDTFATRWGTIDENLLTTDGIGVFDRMDAGYLATAYPLWDFAPVWAFSGRNDTAVGWREKIPFYEAMNLSAHGWSFFWDLRAHGGQAPYPKVWRENGWEDEVFDWMVESIRLDQSYPAFSNCSLNDDPGTGDPLSGDPIGTINGYLRWSNASEDTRGWAVDLWLHPDATADTCVVDVTLRRLQQFALQPGQHVRYQVTSPSGDTLVDAFWRADDLGLLTLPQISVTRRGVRLAVRLTD
jgi:acetyl esterase/lipase